MAWKEYYSEYWLNFENSRKAWIGAQAAITTEILLKTALNTIQSISTTPFHLFAKKLFSKLELGNNF